jgi:hypothetical protein
VASETHSTPTPPVRSPSGGQRQPAVDTYRLDVSLPSTTDIPGEAYTRLVVLVPDGVLDYGKLVQELSMLITPSVSEMVLVGLGQRRSSSPASRRLAGLASITQDLLVPQSKKVFDVSSWAEAVQMVAQPGDLIVCQADRRGDRLVEELLQVAASPVHLLTGLQPPLQTRLARVLKSLIFNLFPFIVVAAFFWLQVQIDAQNTGLIRTLILIMSVLVELGVIFVWSLFIR